MNWYEKHLGDWAKKTMHLTMLEEGAYNRLCDWCYAHERPLPLAMRDVCKIARATNPAERAVVQRVTSEFFTLALDGWHQGRIDKILSTYAERVARNTNNPASPAERARRYRDKRAELFKRAAAVGLNPAFNASNGALEAMLSPQPVNGPSSRDERVTVTDLSPVRVTGSQQPTTNNQRDGVTAATSLAEPLDAFAQAARDAAAANGVLDPTLTGRAAKALKAAGFGLANTADPRFIALVNAGVTEDEWRLTAAEAVARGKAWGWLLATIAGRRADLAHGYVPLAQPMGLSRRDQARVAGLTPTIAARPPKPDAPDSAPSAIPF